MIKGNKRLSNETFSNYKKRLKDEAKKLKSYLRGRYIWLATDIREDWRVIHAGQGTYIRKIHGNIGSTLQIARKEGLLN
jgi:hypothetical protein